MCCEGVVHPTNRGSTSRVDEFVPISIPKCHMRAYTIVHENAMLASHRRNRRGQLIEVCL